MVLTARTRSAGATQSTKKGFYVSTLALSNDLAKPFEERCVSDGKLPVYESVPTEFKVGNEICTMDVRVCKNCGGKLKPISIRTVGRYLRELKAAGMVEVTRGTGPSLICVVPPKSVVDNLPKTSGKPKGKPHPLVRSIGQKSEPDRTPMRVRQSNSQNTIKQFNNSRGFDSTSGLSQKMSKILLDYHRIGVLPNNDYEGFDSWAAVAVEVPQAVRLMFRSMAPELSSEEFDQTIREAGGIALGELQNPRRKEA